MFFMCRMAKLLNDENITITKRTLETFIQSPWIVLSNNNEHLEMTVIDRVVSKLLFVYYDFLFLA